MYDGAVWSLEIAVKYGDPLHEKLEAFFVFVFVSGVGQPILRLQIKWDMKTHFSREPFDPYVHRTDLVHRCSSV